MKPVVLLPHFSCRKWLAENLKGKNHNQVNVKVIQHVFLQWQCHWQLFFMSNNWVSLDHEVRDIAFYPFNFTSFIILVVVCQKDVGEEVKT